MRTLKLTIGIFLALICIAERSPGPLWLAWFGAALISSYLIASSALATRMAVIPGASEPTKPGA